MKDQHTPGPWLTEPIAAHTCSHQDVHTAKGAWIARVIHNGTTNGSVDANARLIAAAPELLAALENYAEQICECDGSDFHECLAHAAIRKAREGK